MLLLSRNSCVYLLDARAADWLGPLTALAGHSTTSCRISSYSKPQLNATGKQHWQYRSHASSGRTHEHSLHLRSHGMRERIVGVSDTFARTRTSIVEPSALDLRTVLAHRLKPQFSTLSISSPFCLALDLPYSGTALLWTCIAVNLQCCGLW